MKFKALFLSALFASSFANAEAQKDDNYNVMASTEAYNRLVFPVPFQKVVIPPDAEVREVPVALKDNLGILIRPAPGAQPVNVFVQLVNGESFTVRLTPSSNPEASVFRYRNATDVQAKPNKVDRPEDGWLTDVIVNAIEGKTPEGFEKGVELPPIRAIVAPKGVNGEVSINKANRIELTPSAHFVGSGYSLKVYRLFAKEAINVEPRDFYREGVIAVSVDGDIVSQKHNPLLVMLEAVNE